MNVRTKIIIIVVPVMLISILAINLVFNAFFSNYLQSQEDSQINTVNNSVYSYITEKTDKYQGNANDWGHWDDTYSFMQGDNTYIDSNLGQDTFKDLGINFFICITNDGSVYEKRYYDFERNSFIQFSDRFINDFKAIASYLASGEDTSSIYELGGLFYFLATSDITDSKSNNSPIGKLVIGRMLNIPEIEDISGCSVVSIDTALLPSEQKMPMVSLLKKSGTDLTFQCIIPGESGASSTAITFKQSRSLYLSGTQELSKYTLSSTLYTVAIVAVLFTLLSIYISAPLYKLTRDIKNIDLKSFKLIDAKGKDEFAFLRRTINSLLVQIDVEKTLVKENEEKLYATLESVGDGVIVVGRDAKIQFINPIAQKLTGWPRKEAIGMDSNEVFKLVNESTGEPIESPIEEVFETEKIVELANHTMLISRDGSEKAIEDTAAPVKDKNGNVVSCVIVFRDFTEKRERQKRIEFLSYHDQLTGLYNRRYLEEELKRLDTKRNLPMSIIYADVNGLKIVNDAFGHNYGDQLIRKVSDAIKDICRADEIISRTGGDEFVILLPKTERTSAEKIVERIAKKLEKSKVMGIGVSMSFGCDSKYAAEQSIWDILKSAEDTMYHKKILVSPTLKSAAIDSVVNVYHAKHPGEKEHSMRVSAMCAALGELKGLSPADIDDLKKAGELHDIGKVSTDEQILNHIGTLDESEWVQLRSHPETGYRILNASNGFTKIADYILEHHERFDGRGYPKGLKGEEISIQGRILILADAYDSMVNDQTFRPAMTEDEAIEELKKNSGTQFDPELVRLFIEKVLNRKY